MKNEADIKTEQLLSQCKIEPSDSLKKRVLRDAPTNAHVPEKHIMSVTVRRIAPIAACFLFIIVAAFVTVGLINEDYMKIYIDVNPSVVLTLNRFERVVGTEYLNADAENGFAETDFKGSRAEDAINGIMERLSEKGYLNDEAEMYISANAKNKGKADALCERLKNKANQIKADKKYNVNVNKGGFADGDVNDAKKVGISPAKYRMIEDIIGKDSSYTLESLCDKSMKELKAIYYKLYGKK